MIEAAAALMGFGSWTALCIIGGWKAQTVVREYKVRQMIARRAKETARQHAQAQAERRQREYAKTKGMQA